MSTSLEEPQNSEIDLPALRVEMGLDNSEFFQTRISRTKKLEIFIDENLGEITEVTQKLWDELDGSEFGLFFSYMQHSGTETSIGDLFEKLHEIFEHLEVETRDRLMYLLSGESVSDITKNLKGDGTSSEKYAFGIAMVIVANMSHLITELGSQIMYFRENGCEDITDKVELVQSLCRRYAALINQFDYISLGQRKLIEVHGITLPTYNEWFLDLKQDLEKVLNLNQSIDISTVNDVNTNFLSTSISTHT